MLQGFNELSKNFAIFYFGLNVVGIVVDNNKFVKMSIWLQNFNIPEENYVL